MRTSRIAVAVRQLTGLFTQEPGRQLSLADAVRLTGLDPLSCEIVLETLQDAHVLSRGGDGRFIRRDDHARPNPTIGPGAAVNRFTG
jgi:hypothetical protein